MATASTFVPSSCPTCRAIIQGKDVDLANTFRCPSCGQSLRASQFYKRRIVLASEVLAGLIAYGLGARGVVLSSAILLGFVPIGMILRPLARRFDAPKLNPSDDYSLNLSSRKT